MTTEREKHIENLKTLVAFLEVNPIFKMSDEMYKSLDYAISSLKTDLKYDLLYEETSGQADKQADKPTTKNDLGVDYLGVDCISRKAVERIINKWLSHSDYELKDHIYSMTEKIHNLPPATPQEPRKGHWVKTPKAVMGEGYIWYCDKCEHQVYQDSSRPYPSEKYCPNCGAKMIEPQERSNEE